MKLLLPANDAIDILSERLNALSYYPFNPTVWQKATVIDIEQIFGSLSKQSMSIDFITFETVVSSQRAEVLKKGIEEAKGLLNSYIRQISKYSEIESKLQITKEFHLQRQINELMVRTAQVENRYALLNASQNTIKTENENLKKQLIDLEQRNQNLIDNTLQLDNVTLNTIWKITQKTPIKEYWPVLLTLAALFGIFFTIGLYWHKFFNK